MALCEVFTLAGRLRVIRQTIKAVRNKTMNDNESAPIATDECVDMGARRLPLSLHVPYLLSVGTVKSIDASCIRDHPLDRCWECIIRRESCEADQLARYQRRVRKSVPQGGEGTTQPQKRSICGQEKGHYRPRRILTSAAPENKIPTVTACQEAIRL